ncbi:MAG: vWA domain-containing protein [Pseudomonadota bacterium]
MGEVTLLRPAALWALLPIFALGIWLWQRRDGLGDWKRAADPALLRAMAALGKVEEGAYRTPMLLALTFSMLVVLAWSGPAIERRDAVSYRNLDGVLFLVDVSDSVTEHPDWSGLMLMGRFGISSLGTRPGGLIAFAGDAYVATDMTHDHVQLGQTLSFLETDLVPDAGSRPERALALAADLLRDAKVLAGDVIVLTDGDGLGRDSLTLVDELARQGARVSFLAPGTPTASMDSHARAGSGRVFTQDDIEAFGAWIGEDERRRLEEQDYPLLFWRDYGRNMLWLALIPLLALFRREAL